MDVLAQLDCLAPDASEMACITDTDLRAVSPTRSTPHTPGPRTPIMLTKQASCPSPMLEAPSGNRCNHHRYGLRRLKSPSREQQLPQSPKPISGTKRRSKRSQRQSAACKLGRAATWPAKAGWQVMQLQTPSPPDHRSYADPDRACDSQGDDVYARNFVHPALSSSPMINQSTLTGRVQPCTYTADTVTNGQFLVDVQRCSVGNIVELPPTALSISQHFASNCQTVFRPPQFGDVDDMNTSMPLTSPVRGVGLTQVPLGLPSNGAPVASSHVPLHSSSVSTMQWQPVLNTVHNNDVAAAAAAVAGCYAAADDDDDDDLEFEELLKVIASEEQDLMLVLPSAQHGLGTSILSNAICDPYVGQHAAASCGNYANVIHQPATAVKDATRSDPQRRYSTSGNRLDCTGELSRLGSVNMDVDKASMVGVAGQSMDQVTPYTSAVGPLGSSVALNLAGSAASNGQLLGTATRHVHSHVVAPPSSTSCGVVSLVDDDLVLDCCISAEHPTRQWEVQQAMAMLRTSPKQYLYHQHCWLLLLNHCAVCDRQDGSCQVGASCSLGKMLYR